MTEDIHPKVSADMHPDNVRGDAPGAHSARAAMGALYEAEGKIRDMHSQVHSTAMAHQKQMMMPKSKTGAQASAPPLVYDRAVSDMVIENGKTIAQSALKTADQTIVSLAATLGRLDAQIDGKIMAGKNPARGAELRAWAAKLDSPFTKMGELFQDAAANPTLVAEVLGGEHFLSGISRENHDMLRTVAAHALAPDETAARHETAAAKDQLTKSAKKFTENAAQVLNSLVNPAPAAIEAIVKRGTK